jgi:hypothetical protein
MPWALTQKQPLDAAAFISEAAKRGFTLDIATLRELYRRRLLIPFMMLTHQPVRPPAKPREPDSPFGGTLLKELQHAHDTGRLRDLSSLPYMSRLAWERSRQKSQGWWNGMIYSYYQLLVLPTIENILVYRRYQKRGRRRLARLPEPDAILRHQTGRLRKMAVALTALDARYLPNLDPEWIQVSDVLDPEDWAGYRESFDPVPMQAWLAYPPEQIRQDAEWLLTRAHTVDPVGTDWSRLMRRAPAKSRKYLKDAALLALDARIAAEILLRFYEDLAHRRQAEPLPDLSVYKGWHPLHERLSNHPETLDDDLVCLGISPHPRVVLALEGETEMYHAPLVWRVLGFSEAPELMRLLKLGGTSQDLTKVAAVTAAPLVGGQVRADAWKLIKPYTRLFVAVDPDSPFTTPERVAAEKTKIINEIRGVLKAQGVTRPNSAELDELVEIRVWDAPCYEFAHFTDDELADGLIEVHPTIDGWTRDELVEALSYWRAKKKDIKRVWESGRWIEPSKSMTGRWEPEPSKVKLAEALWPTLLRKIHLYKTMQDAPVPPIVAVINDAYHVAQQWRYLSYLLTEVVDAPDTRPGE